MNLLENPFHLLGVSTRDTIQRIVQAAEERSLLSDSDACMKARACLTNPRQRLAAEIAWLPGLSPARVSDIVNKIESNPIEVSRMLSSVEPLPQCNIAVSMMQRMSFANEHKSLEDWLLFISRADEKIEPKLIMSTINEDRTIAKVPLLQNIADIEEELTGRRKYFANLMLNSLRKVANPDVRLTSILRTASVNNGGLPAILEDLVDDYQVEVTKYLDQLEMKMDMSIDNIKKYAHVGRGTSKSVEAPINDLITLLRSWDQIIDPIHILAQNRGIEHDRSSNMAHKIRDIAIHLANKYGLHTEAKKISESMAEVFKEITQLSDRIEEDKTALSRILENKSRTEQQEEEWAKEISLDIEFGRILKDRLRISPKEFTFNGVTLPLDKINRVRWGGLVNYTNGIKSGTSYGIWVGTNERLISIECAAALERDATAQDRYHTIIKKLWRAVCVRLLSETLSQFSRGYKIRYGDIVVDKDGIMLQKKRFLGSDPYYAKWEELSTGNAAGCFVITARKEPKASASLSYRDQDNAHILEAIMEFL